MLMRLWCGWGKGCWWGNGCWWGKGEERHDRRKVMGEGKQLRESSWWWKGIAEGKKLTRKRSWQWEKANEGKMLKQERCCSRKEWLLLGWKVNDAGLKSNCCLGKEWMQLMHKVLLPSEHCCWGNAVWTLQGCCSNGLLVSEVMLNIKQGWMLLFCKVGMLSVFIMLTSFRFKIQAKLRSSQKLWCFFHKRLYPCWVAKLDWGKTNNLIKIKGWNHALNRCNTAGTLPLITADQCATWRNREKKSPKSYKWSKKNSKSVHVYTFPHFPPKVKSREKRIWHVSHLNGFSPLCLRWCVCKSLSW